MKKSLKAILFPCLAFLAMGLVYVLSSYSPPAAAASGCVGSTYYVNSVAYPVYTGKLDTINGAVNDTFKLKCGCKPASITFSNNAWHVGGATTLNVVVSLYASADGGATFGTAALTTYTVTPVNVYSVTAGALCNTYIVNNTYGGNPYTDYMWVAAGTASTTASWQGSVLVR